MEAVSEQAQLTFTISNKMYTISTRKVIFIFISDIGADTYVQRDSPRLRSSANPPLSPFAG